MDIGSQKRLHAVISSLRRLATPDICDALIRPRVMSSSIRPITRVKKLVGAAVTARVQGGSTSTIQEAIAVASAGDILVVESRSNGEVAILGGILASKARRRGLEGVIVDGFARDVEEIKRLRLPVWARGTCPYATHKKLPGRLNASVICGGVTVDPNDIVVADSDGIVVVSPSEAIEASGKGRQIRREEAKRLRAIRR